MSDFDLSGEYHEDVNKLKKQIERLQARLRDCEPHYIQRMVNSNYCKIGKHIDWYNEDVVWAVQKIESLTKELSELEQKWEDTRTPLKTFQLLNKLEAENAELKNDLRQRTEYALKRESKSKDLTQKLADAEGERDKLKERSIEHSNNYSCVFVGEA